MFKGLHHTLPVHIISQNDNIEPGNITTVTSTMFGGKSLYALHAMESRSKAYRNRYETTKVVLYVNSSFDDRNGTETPFSTHSEIITLEALDKIGVNFIKVSKLTDITDDFLRLHKVVFIDEAQFFPDLVERTLHIAENLGIDVYAMGLTTDYRRKVFGDLGYLSLIADDSITLRTTFCRFCAEKGVLKKAIHSHRISDTSGVQIEVGAENYAPVCRKCYIRENKL